MRLGEGLYIEKDCGPSRSRFRPVIRIQFKNTPKAFANFSPGFEAKRELWG